MSDFYNGGNGGGGGGTPAITELFEVYIDEDNASNNRNVVYNDILNAVNSGKYVYLVVKGPDGKLVYTIQTCDSNYIVFSSLRPEVHYFANTYYIDNDNSYSKQSQPLVPSIAVIDESKNPIVFSNINFVNLSNWFQQAFDHEIILRYTKPNGDKYKLRAVKLTSTEISFSVYDIDSARPLSIYINDQNQYTVIT